MSNFFAILLSAAILSSSNIINPEIGFDGDSVVENEPSIEIVEPIWMDGFVRFVYGA